MINQAKIFQWFPAQQITGKFIRDPDIAASSWMKDLRAGIIIIYWALGRWMVATVLSVPFGLRLNLWEPMKDAS